MIYILWWFILYNLYELANQLHSVPPNVILMDEEVKVLHSCRA